MNLFIEYADFRGGVPGVRYERAADEWTQKNGLGEFMARGYEVECSPNVCIQYGSIGDAVAALNPGETLTVKMRTDDEMPIVAAPPRYNCDAAIFQPNDTMYLHCAQEKGHPGRHCSATGWTWS